MKEKALSNLRVIDLTHFIAGPYCTKLMAGFGAEIIKIERPGTGDGMRRSGPFYRNQEGLETSIPFLWLNTGKKSITLNLKTDRGRTILRDLVRDADVLIENFSPGVMHGYGLHYEKLREINPGLVMTSVSNFGQTGPYSDYKAEETEIQALSGIMYMTGDPDREPLASGPALCQYTAGQHAYIATLMALFQRRQTGQGQYIDVSIQESGLEHIEIALSYNLQQGRQAKRGEHLFVPWDIYKCQDGYATIIGMPARHWRRAEEILQDATLFDKKYLHVLDRIGYRSEYEKLLKSRVKTHRKKELFHAGQERQLAFGYVADLDDVIESPQHKARGFFTEIDHPSVGRHRYCDAPFQMSETPWQSDRAPLLGEHNREIYTGIFGYTQQEVRQLAEDGVI
jgi:crotonobetainyl-CoA:carnitine CoA-transferase CaiB-like acyl-CoA transferase